MNDAKEAVAQAVKERRPAQVQLSGCGAVCGGCGNDLNYTGCSAATCDGWLCAECGAGCDIDDGDGSVCCDEIDATVSR